MPSCRDPRPANERLIPMASEGFLPIAVSAFVTVYLGALGFGVVALFFGAVTVFLAFFFRDPERETPEQAGVVVSPADGKVVEVGVVQGSEFASEEALKISVFMTVFNVHVNRIPADGKIAEISYHPGKFFSANLDKASRDNERNAVTLEMEDGRRFTVVQVAGLIARRIVCKVHEGDRLKRGERFGMICFGSRLDVYLPSDTRPAVALGDKVLAGVSVLGHLT
ncbi:MAG: phosphatidylserine decarboxylase family protein [Thermodesulfobacteriota bacterium]|nr:phosphatidylserine decarboxylase family protein [Thermodesulfobacteriota bacterium]